MSFQQQQREHGRFALLHDMTNCLRIGDVTVFHDRNDDEQDVLLYELKTNPLGGRVPAHADSLGG